jgi:hypothetical protein
MRTTRRVIAARPGAVGGSHATCTTWIVHMLSLITRPRNIHPRRTWRRSRRRGCCRFDLGRRWGVVGRTLSVEHGCAGRGADANGSERRCCCQNHSNLSLHSHGDLHLGKRCNLSVSAHALCDPPGIPKSAPSCFSSRSSSNAAGMRRRRSRSRLTTRPARHTGRRHPLGSPHLRSQLFTAVPRHLGLELLTRVGRTIIRHFGTVDQ